MELTVVRDMGSLFCKGTGIIFKLRNIKGLFLVCGCINEHH